MILNENGFESRFVKLHFRKGCVAETPKYGYRFPFSAITDTPVQPENEVRFIVYPTLTEELKKFPVFGIAKFMWVVLKPNDHGSTIDILDSGSSILLSS